MTCALAYVKYKYFKTSPETRARYSRAYWYCSKQPRLIELVGDGGDLWVVTAVHRDEFGNRVPSSRRGDLRCSLAYCLRSCQPFDVDERRRAEFGRYGVMGDLQDSQHYAENDVTDVLMKLQFASSNPIKKWRTAPHSLQTIRELTPSDVGLLELYEQQVRLGKNVFLSYSRKNSAEADRIDAALQAAGHTVWRDVRSIVGGDRWKEALDRDLARAKAVVVLMSNDSADSDWVAEEIRLARSYLKRPTGPERIVPFELHGAARRGFPQLADFQCISAVSGDMDAAVERLTQDLRLVTERS
jgi:hypothetical protein